MMLLLMAGALHRARLRKSPIPGQNSAKRSGIFRNSAAGHLEETGVPLLPFDPYPVAVEARIPACSKNPLDGPAYDARALSVRA
jgi:hypothetical protein